MEEAQTFSSTVDRPRLSWGVAAVCISGAYFLLKTFRASQSKSSLKTLRGPRSPSFVMGHFPDIVDPTPELVEGWLNAYGSTFAVYLPLNEKAIYSADPRATTFIFNNAMGFRKPDLEKAAIYAITGPGVFAMEGEVNRKQVGLLLCLLTHLL